MTTPTSAARARGWARAGEVGAGEEIFLRGVVGGWFGGRGLGTDPTIVNKIKGLRGFGGWSGVEGQIWGRKNF